MNERAKESDDGTGQFYRAKDDSSQGHIAHLRKVNKSRKKRKKKRTWNGSSSSKMIVLRVRARESLAMLLIDSKISPPPVIYRNDLFV